MVNETPSTLTFSTVDYQMFIFERLFLRAHLAEDRALSVSLNQRETPAPVDGKLYIEIMQIIYWMGCSASEASALADVMRNG